MLNNTIGNKIECKLKKDIDCYKSIMGILHSKNTEIVNLSENVASLYGTVLLVKSRDSADKLPYQYTNGKPINEFIIKIVITTTDKTPHIVGNTNYLLINPERHYLSGLVNASGVDLLAVKAQYTNYITPYSKFLNEIETQNTIYKRSLEEDYDALVPYIINYGEITDFKKHTILHKYIKVPDIENLKKNARKMLSKSTNINIDGVVFLKQSDLKVNYIIMESLTNYTPLLSVYRSLTKDDNFNEKIKEFSIKTSRQHTIDFFILIYGVFRLYKYGYCHSDLHGNNVFINRDKPYFSGGLLGKVMFIDFGIAYENLDEDEDFFSGSDFQYIKEVFHIDDENVKKIKKVIMQFDRLRKKYIKTHHHHPPHAISNKKSVKTTNMLFNKMKKTRKARK